LRERGQQLGQARRFVRQRVGLVLDVLAPDAPGTVAASVVACSR